MEEDKRKKKNKKKKNKQGKGSDALANGGVSASVQDQQDHRGQTSENADVQTLVVTESEAKVDMHSSDGVGNATVDEEEKQLWLQKEKYLEEQIQKFQLAKHDWILKEASLEEKVKQLQTEKDYCIQKEAELEDKLKLFDREKDSWALKEAELEDKLKLFNSEKESWALKEAELEDNIKRLESDKESWALKETSNKEIVTRLKEDNIQLQHKVNELEASRDDFLQENQRLAETITILESQIENLVKDVSSHVPSTTETVHGTFQHGDANAQMEADVLVERGGYENAQVNEPGIELAQRNSSAGNSSISTLNFSMVLPETSIRTYDIPEPSEQIPQFTERLDSPVIYQNEDHRDRSEDAQLESIAVTEVQIETSADPYEAEETEEIVQVPLYDNEITDLEEQTAETDEITGVPLTDAPLIGAPFRLISFFAKYVSGADLVNKNTSSSR